MKKYSIVFSRLYEVKSNDNEDALKSARDEFIGEFEFLCGISDEFSSEIIDIEQND